MPSAPASDGRMFRPAGDERGFSMVEIAVAIVVLGILLVSLLPFVASSIMLAAENQQRARANELVASRIEALRTAPSCADGTHVTAEAGFTVEQHATGCGTPLATVRVRVLLEGSALAETTTRVATGSAS